MAEDAVGSEGPPARWQHCMVTTGEHLYILGGSGQGGSILADVYRFWLTSSPSLQCSGSVTFWYGSGSVSRPFRQWPSRHQQIIIFFPSFFFLLITLWRYGTFTLFFKDKISWISHKTIEIQVVLTIFAWWWKEPEPDPYFQLRDSDPGGPKTSGSRKLLTRMGWKIYNL